jgi:hypothetical protein
MISKYLENEVVKKMKEIWENDAKANRKNPFKSLGNSNYLRKLGQSMSTSIAKPKECMSECCDYDDSEKELESSSSCSDCELHDHKKTSKNNNENFNKN